ncbi:uncharacterized protein LOC123269077 isoform X2 [Cotesia glomerata]|uniref:uncharacterized protein LOC123269077 isoform X2 n=1 Tax=Cotesia glomerata TaxID=32391 RepID=UPI001D004E39|nr:uncharacterized protein LOC123269077 isoform X2 [Cotesia glomerata]
MQGIIYLIFWIGVCQGQLNYEGNPLTENTEFTAEETHYHTNYDRRKLIKQLNNNTADINVTTGIHAYNNTKNTSSILIKPGSSDKNDDQLLKVASNLNPSPAGTLKLQVSPVNPSSKVHDFTASMQMKARQYPPDQSRNFNKVQVTARQIGSSSSVISNEALNTFLNSRTPAESQFALDNYLQSTSSQVDAQEVRPVNVNVDNMNTNTNTNNNIKFYEVLPSASAASSSSLVAVDQQLNTGQVDNAVSNFQPVTMAAITDVQPDHQVYQTYPLWHQPALQNRHDYIQRRRPYYRGGMGRYRQRIQPRLSHGYVGKGPGLGPPPGPIGLGPGPMGLGPDPVPYASKPEIIYTKPPGASLGYPPGPVNNLPYEDASAHFSALSHPPPPKENVYYSQLYAQSYDPHYYNYIAKTGKIKPWLYGKLGRQPEETSFWGELFQSFMKHGMKNMMNPMFLLGLSIPAITLMLSAIVPKRSFGRSSNNYGDYLTEEKINELAERVRQAVKCYESNKLSDKSNCW